MVEKRKRKLEIACVSGSTFQQIGDHLAHCWHKQEGIGGRNMQQSSMSRNGKLKSSTSSLRTGLSVQVNFNFSLKMKDLCR